MYADVVVLTYQSPEIDSYTYLVPKELEKELKIGQIVTVPFGKRNPLGVVISLRDSIAEFTSSSLKTRQSLNDLNKNEILLRQLADQNDRGEGLQNDKSLELKNIRDIGEILLARSIVLPYQIELLKWMPFYYHAPMVNCLKAILPEIPKKKFTVISSQFTEKTINHQPSTINQTLVLVPSINRLPETLAKYREAKNYVIYHNELRVADKFSSWLKILSGNVDFVFGSRSAIFTPCPKLTKIIIYDEHDGAYKDERSPYYDTLTVAEKLQELTGAKLQIIDSSPKITTYFNHKQNIILERSDRISNRFYRGFQPLQNDKNTKVQIVSMLAEKAAGNKSPISELLSTYLKAAVQRQKKVLLFLNKKTESGHIYCKNCKHNDFATKQPALCPNCQSPDVWFYSINVNSLASLVKKIIPQANINIIAEGYKQQTTNNKLQTIDIATSSVFYKLSPQKYNLVANIQTDSLLNSSDFNSAEKLFSQIADLKKLCLGLLLLQTYNPHHLAINFSAKSNYDAFAKNQLEERRTLAYPPFSLLIKLSLKGKNEESLEAKAQKLYEELDQSIVNSQLSNVKLLGPYKPIFQRTVSIYNIILKIVTTDYSLKFRENAIKLVEPLLAKVPGNWQRSRAFLRISRAFLRIEVEPESIN